MKRVLSLGVGLLLAGAAVVAQLSPARAEGGNFSLQVSPSPLVTTVKPGETKTLDLKIRNASTSDEQLKIEARSFTFDSVTGAVSLDDTLAPGIAQWLTLPAPGFTVQAGEWQTKQITVSLPKNAGFSYSFSLIVSRNEAPSATSAGQLLKGSVAVFTLINVDRPDATRKLEISSLATSQKIYEFLPTTISVRLKNTGNSIVQPYGNLFIQRGDDDKSPLATLPINDSQAYILPGTERSIDATWDDGFPAYTTSTDTSGVTKTSLEWNIDKISHFRFGKYTAKVVAVYNDGTRDVPIVGEVTFWVIPWKTLLILLGILIAVVLLFRRYVKFRTDRAVKKALKKQENGL